MRLLSKSLTESIYDSLTERVDFETMVWDRISEYADPEEYFLDKLTDKDVKTISKDLEDIWMNGNFEQSDLDDVMEKYAAQKYGSKNESLKEGKYVVKYWETENDRDEGFSETEYIEASDVEEAISKTRDMYYDNSWASCELGNANDEEVENPIFGMYPEEKKVKEERYTESVMVNTGSTTVVSDETGVTIETNGTTITSGNGVTVDIDNEEDLVPMDQPVEDMGVVEEPTDGEEVEDTEEDVIEPSEELIEPEEDEELIEESVEEGKGKVTSEDLNSEGVNYVFTYGDQEDPKTEYLTCFWSSNEVDQEDIPEGENLDDYGAINYTIYDTEGNDVDGGLFITKEDSFDEEELLRDLCGLSGYNETRFIDIRRKPNGDYTEVFGLEEKCNNDEEDKLEENAGDPNSTVEIYKNPEYDYQLVDVTELNNVDVGDVRSIDMMSLANKVEENLVERYGTKFWGILNPFVTRKGTHKKTNESYASALLDICIPPSSNKQEYNTVLSFEVYGNKSLKECVIKSARHNRKIDKWCGQSKDPVKFLENVVVDIIEHRPMNESPNYKIVMDKSSLKEEVSNEAYEIADYIDKRCGDRLQDGVNGERILRRDDFDELFIEALRKFFKYNDDDLDNIWSSGKLPNGDDLFDLENTVRGILSYSGYETIFENDEDRNADEGDLVKISQVTNEAVEYMVDEPYDDKGMNFADGKAIDKDVKRQERHLKQHKALGKTTKSFKIDKEPDQKNTAGKTVEELSDTVDTKEGDGKKKSPSKKKKAIKESVENNNTFWEKGFKPGDKLKASFGEVKIIDLNKGENYILVSRDTDYQPYVAAWYPCLDGDELYWGQGHYYDNLEDAKKYFEKIKLGESVNEDADRIVLDPIENFDFIDPYGVYYKDSNGNLYKSVDNGNELYICTKAGEPLKDVNPENYILGDKALNELTEAKGLLDDEDEVIEDNSEELIDTNDELEEGATEVAIFHRKPESIDVIRQAEANGITQNKSNYKVIATKELSNDEFEDFSKHLVSKNYQWLKDLYNDANKDNSGMYYCIEVKNKDDDSLSLLVDPNGFDYARYVAIKENLNSDEQIEEPIEEPEEEINNTEE